MRIIGFGYETGVGKDTAGKFLITCLRTTKKGLNVQRRSLGSKIKDVAYQLYKWAGLQEELYYENNREARYKVLPLIDKTPVQIWIDVSNALTNGVFDRTWSMYLVHCANKCDIAVCCDVRRPEQVTAILESGGAVYKVVRDQPFAAVKDRSVECQLDGFDGWTGVITNNSCLDDLYKQVAKIAEGL